MNIFVLDCVSLENIMSDEQLIHAIEILLNSRFECLVNDITPQKEIDSVLHTLFETLIGRSG